MSVTKKLKPKTSFAEYISVSSENKSGTEIRGKNLVASRASKLKSNWPSPKFSGPQLCVAIMQQRKMSNLIITGLNWCIVRLHRVN